MRIIHTSDWHLGHTLHEVSREKEQQSFLDWLLDTIGEHLADALLICGDIFDSANPPASAQRLWYGFLAGARRRFPRLAIVAMGGNHDSAARLDAPDPVLGEFGIRVVGGVPYGEDGTVLWDQLVIPLHDAGGAVSAWIAAVPYLRPADLPPVPEGEGDPLVEGVRRFYVQAIAAASRHRQPGQPLIVTGHCYMTGGTLSELSERKILGGNQHALPADLFGEGVAYGALGHLHLPQTVGGRPHIRYSGAPIPLSLGEADYPSQVVLVELHGEACTAVQPIRVPRTVEMLRIPARGALPLDELLPLLVVLPESNGNDIATAPYLEVSVALDRPDPSLRQRLAAVLAGKAIRLMKITPVYPGSAGPLASAAPERSLRDFTPEEVFVQRYRSTYDDDPPPELLAAFHTLVEDVTREVTP
ncbi:exonuclease SbcCD subunit D C-terminal domain-containing protein [Geobacter sp.]|uniref:exonuclease SbcCD subunit D C-terminal domain-containing protein n=1 Tax=Geobacter sp. TaxID=46610 RepID=UPI0027BA5667|nr:exonuclease SbcCD subunit D C-terminal domain-containing protein [Geobacter sp.]